MQNPDYKMYPHIYNVVALKGQHFPNYFNTLIDPFDKEETVRKSEREFEKIKVPTYTGSGWYGYTYKTHLQGHRPGIARSAFSKSFCSPGLRTWNARGILFTGRS
jgi:hypothetical protein